MLRATAKPVDRVPVQPLTWQRDMGVAQLDKDGWHLRVPEADLASYHTKDAESR